MRIGYSSKEVIKIGDDIFVRFVRSPKNGNRRVIIQAPRELVVSRLKLSEAPVNMLVAHERLNDD